MIRVFNPQQDSEPVLDIWLRASIKAHAFVPAAFWESNLPSMRDTYLPNSQTFVYVENERVKGFFSLCSNVLAAVFVDPDCWRCGIGAKLVEKALTLRRDLTLTVYAQNTASVEFYKKQGFAVVGKQLDKHTGCPELVMEFKA